MRQNLVNGVVSLSNLIKIIHLNLLLFLFLVIHVVVYEIEFTVESNIGFLGVMKVHHLGRLSHQHVILRTALQMLVRLSIDAGHHHVVVVGIWLEVGHSPVSKEASGQRTLKHSHLLIHLHFLLNQTL